MYLVKPFIAIFLILVTTQSAFAKPIDLQGGLTIDPPEELDLTYQIIPTYDEHEKVIAGWAGEKLQYFVSVQQLPPEYLDAKKYLLALAQDLKASWGNLDIGKQVTYNAEYGLAVTAIEFSKPSKEPSKAVTLFVHFLSDGKSSFVAIATATSPEEKEAVFEKTYTILQTAHISEAPSKIQSNSGYPPLLVGTWIAKDTLPDGRKIISKTEFKSDLTFSTTTTANEIPILSASGAWFVTGDTLVWIYLHSAPELPSDAREDRDTIISIESGKLKLKSNRTGKEHTFERQE